MNIFSALKQFCHKADNCDDDGLYNPDTEFLYCFMSTDIYAFHRLMAIQTCNRIL